MNLEPKPDGKRLSRQRGEKRAKEFPQVRLVLSARTVAYLRAVSRRTGLQQRQVLDQLVTEAQKLERAVKGLGYTHVGELLAVFRELKGMR